MPPCTHCEFTRCPKCGHDCGCAPKPSSQAILDDSKVREVSPEFWDMVKDAPELPEGPAVMPAKKHRIEILDNSIPSARLVYRNDDRPTLDNNELQQADTLMSIFNLRRVLP